MPYHHGDLHDSLIETATYILHEEGWEKVTFRRLAREIGVSHNAPYRHFKNRNALFVELVQQSFQKLKQQLNQAIQTNPDNVKSQLIAFGWQYVEFALENPTLYPLMFNRMILYKEDEVTNPDLLTTFDNASHALIDIFKVGQTLRQIQNGDAAKQALAFWALLHGITLLCIEDQITVPFVTSDLHYETIIKSSIETLLQGVLVNS